MSLVVSVIGINVPKNICGKININDNPVAVPELFAIVAVIRPNPTELRENIAINRKANKNPPILVLGLNPKGNARKNTINTCNIAIIMFEKTWLPMKSPEVIGVEFNLLSKPCSLISLKD